MKHIIEWAFWGGFSAIVILFNAIMTWIMVGIVQAEYWGRGQSRIELWQKDLIGFLYGIILMGSLISIFDRLKLAKMRTREGI